MTGIHPEPHPSAGKTLILMSGSFAGSEYIVEDWWDRIGGRSWMACDGNPACLEYAVRSVSEDDPLSNEVVYGKLAGRGKIVHVRHLAGRAAT